MRNILMGACSLAAVASMSAPASAAHIDYFTAMLTELNGSGVTGKANLTHDTTADLLTVHIVASNLVPGMVHPQHIHGRLDPAGNAIESNVPTRAVDMDNDGFIEVAEGQETYGPVILPLTSPPGAGLPGFPTAPDGNLDFLQTYDLDDPGIFADGFSGEDLLPLVLREIVLHGDFDPPGVGDGTTGEIDGTDGYEPSLPVAAGEIRVANADFNVIPLPAAGWMLLSALAGLGLLGRSARRTREV